MRARSAVTPQLTPALAAGWRTPLFASFSFPVAFAAAPSSAINWKRSLTASPVFADVRITWDHIRTQCQRPPQPPERASHCCSMTWQRALDLISCANSSTSSSFTARTASPESIKSTAAERTARRPVGSVSQRTPSMHTFGCQGPRVAYPPCGVHAGLERNSRFVSTR